MTFLNKLFSWYGKKRVFTFLLVIILLVVWGIIRSGDGEVKVAETENKLMSVKVTTANQIGDSEQLSLVGKVRALSEVDITPDQSGRVTRVNTSLGQQVRVGQIIIELENASERAALLQAEGVYELARANSAQSDVGLREAEHLLENAVQTAKNTNQNSYNSINNVILGTVDLFFSNPNSYIPGLRIGGAGNTSLINNERIAFQTILPTWKNSIDKKRDIDAELENLQDVRTDVVKTLNLINVLIPLLSNTKSVDGYTEAEIADFRSKLTSAQTETTNTLSNLDTAYTGLKNAKENFERAKLTVSGGNTSVSDAQMKQALGALRSAQANYDKTILRSPINGTVNELDIKLGEFVSANVPVAKIANNTKSEVVAYVSDEERESINVGEEIMINGNIKGQIAVIAPALDSLTQKIEVRIVSDSDELVIGETVRITGVSNQNENTSEINLPLTAVKFDDTKSYVLVIENDVLKRQDIQVGKVRGNVINIISGLDANTEFVLDARGKSVGDKVEVTRN